MPPQDPSQPQQPQPQPNGPGQPYPQQPSDTLAIIGLVLAFVFSPVGFVLSIIALVKAKTSLSKTLGIAGTVVGAFGSIVTIGLIAALVATTTGGIQQKARDVERTTDLKTLQSQLEAYYANHGQYPSNNDLGNDSSKNVSWITTNMPGMDKEALHDPRSPLGDYALGTNRNSDRYTYAPVNAGGHVCDDTKTNPCVHYTLSATPDAASSANIEYTSLN